LLLIVTSSFNALFCYIPGTNGNRFIANFQIETSKFGGYSVSRPDTSSYKLVRSDSMTMRWGEMDALSHMNNVAYMRYFEEVRIAWFEELPITYHPKGEGPILGTITCRYIKSAVYPARFIMTTYVGDLGRSSFKMHHQMMDADDTTVIYAEADAVLVWADIGEGKSRPVPGWLRAIIQDR
jgi:acyl-CoA thioester hydrolase